MDQDWPSETVRVLTHIMGMIPVSARLSNLFQMLAFDSSNAGF